MVGSRRGCGRCADSNAWPLPAPSWPDMQSCRTCAAATTNSPPNCPPISDCAPRSPSAVPVIRTGAARGDDTTALDESTQQTPRLQGRPRTSRLTPSPADAHFRSGDHRRGRPGRGSVSDRRAPGVLVQDRAADRPVLSQVPPRQNRQGQPLLKSALGEAAASAALDVGGERVGRVRDEVCEPTDFERAA